MKETAQWIFEPLNVSLAAIVVAIVIATAAKLIYDTMRVTPSMGGHLNGVSKIKLWKLIKPIIVKGYVEVENILKDNDLTYEEVEEVVLTKLMVLIRAAKFLTAEQKAVLTEDIIRAWVRPSLKVFYKEVKERKAQEQKTQ